MAEIEQVQAAEEGSQDTLAELRARAEQLEHELASARRDAEARIIQAELKAEAVRAGIIDLDGLRLIDHSSVCLDPRGEVVGAKEIMAGLKRAKPWLFGAASSSSTAATPAAQAPRPKHATEMRDAEYRAARADLLKRRS
jgi:hypothetical protein